MHNKVTNKQSNKQTNKQTNKQASKQNTQANKTRKQTERLKSNRQLDRQSRMNVFGQVLLPTLVAKQAKLQRENITAKDKHHPQNVNPR